MKKLNSLLLCFMLILSLLSLATANTGITSITIDTPVVGSSIRGTYSFGVTYVGNGSANVATTNITFYNDTSLATVLCTIPGSSLVTANQTVACTNITSGLSDDCTGHTILASYSNTSQLRLINDTNTGIIFDNTNATFTRFTVDRPTSKLHKPLSYTVTGASDVCDSSPTTYTLLTKPDGNTVSKNGTVETWGLSDVNQLGTYTALMTVSDDAGGIAQSTVTFEVIGSGSSEELSAASAIQQQKQAGTSGLALLIILGGSLALLFCLAGMGYYLYNKGKR